MKANWEKLWEWNIKIILYYQSDIFSCVISLNMPLDTPKTGVLLYLRITIVIDSFQNIEDIRFLSEEIATLDRNDCF